jgi:cytochrome c
MRDRNKMIRGKMMSVRISRLAARVVVLLSMARLLLISPAMAADAEHGKALFAPCAACHTERTDALGPDLKGVFGRKSAAIEDFRYSNAMKRANLVWDEDNLRAYIRDPQAKVKGNRMPYGGMSDPKDVDDVVAYLKTLK